MLSQVSPFRNLRFIEYLLLAAAYRSLLLEGGGTLNMSALKAGIVNHIQAYIAPKIFGGSGIYNPVKGESVSVPSEAYICKNMNITHIGDDILIDCDI